MIAMIDEIFDRQYRASRQQLNASLSTAAAGAVAAIANAFAVLNRIEYSAPWNERSRCSTGR